MISLLFRYYQNIREDAQHLFHRADGHPWAAFVLLCFLILSTVILPTTLGNFDTKLCFVT